MDEVSMSGWVALNIQEALKEAWGKEKDFGLARQAISTKDTLVLIEKMDSESLNGRMVTSIKETFVKTWGKVRDTCSGATVVFTKESGKEAFRMAEECSGLGDKNLATAFSKITF